MAEGPSLWYYGKQLVKEAGADDISGAAAELAYRFFLALFPFFIFLAAAGGFAANIFGVQNPTDEVIQFMGDTLPADATSVLRTQLEGVIEEQNSALLSIGIVSALWAASSGVNTIMKAMNRAYDVTETRPIWKRYGISLGLTLLGGGALIAAFALLVVGQVAGLEIAEAIGLEGAASTLFTLARWPIVVLLIIVSMAVLYWAAPNVDLPFKFITPGAVLFTIVWLAASFLFGLYVSNFGAYNATYGTLGGIVVLLIWFYITALILMLGAEVNALTAKEVAPEELPQTADEGATSETVPDHRKAEAAAKRPQTREPAGATLTAQTTPHADRRQRESDGHAGSPARTQDANVQPSHRVGRPEAPSFMVTAVGLLVAVATFWRLARRDAGVA